MTDRSDFDSLDETRQHDVASFSPAPEPRPDWSASAWNDPEPVRSTAADCAPARAVPPTGPRDGGAQDADAASAVGHGEPHADSGCPQSPTTLAAGAP